MPTGLSAIALALVTLLFLIRAPRAIRQRFAPTGPQHLPPAWLATGYAILGLLTLGLVWPAAELDQALPLLGSQNFLNLIEALSATAGFWYLRDAVRLYTRDQHRGKKINLIALCLLQTVFFLAIPDRPGSPATFVDGHLASIACWLYITIYMLGILTLAISSLRSAYSRRAALTGQAFIIGFILVIAAAIADLGYSLTGHLAGELTPAGSALFLTFELCFYPGMVVILIGYLLPILSRLLWRGRGWQLERMNGAPASLPLALRVLRNTDPLGHAYALTIEIQGRLLASSLTLSPRDNRRFRRSERWITTAIITPAGRTWKA